MLILELETHIKYSLEISIVYKYNRKTVIEIEYAIVKIIKPYTILKELAYWFIGKVVTVFVNKISDVFSRCFRSLHTIFKKKYLFQKIPSCYSDCTLMFCFCLWLFLLYRPLRGQSSDKATQEHVEEPRTRCSTKEGEGKSSSALFAHVRQQELTTLGRIRPIITISRTSYKIIIGQTTKLEKGFLKFFYFQAPFLVFWIINVLYSFCCNWPK